MFFIFFGTISVIGGGGENQNCQKWLNFKGHLEKSLSLDTFALIKGQITAGS